MFPRIALLFVLALAVMAPPASSAPKHPKTKVSAKPRPSKAEVTGTASYRERMTFGPSATFEATLEEMTRPDMPGRVIGHDQQPNFGRTPIAFSIRYNPRRIDPARTYMVHAEIREHGRLLLSSGAVPVLTRGHGARATLVMRPLEYMVKGGERDHEMERRDADREREINRDREEYRERETRRERTRVSERDRGRAAEEQRAALERARWSPVQIGGRNVHASGQEPWIEFDSRSSHIDGSGGCNRITGGYEATGTSLRIHTLASTMMSCPSMDTERAFLRALDRTRTYRVQGRELELYDDTGSLLARLEERSR